jgi:hypothetical protein
MRATFIVIGRSTAFALARLLLVALIWSDDGKTSQNHSRLAKATAEAGKFCGDHANLQALAASWIYRGRAWMDPSKSPLETKDKIQHTWALGSLDRAAGTGFDGKIGFEERPPPLRPQ